MQDKRHRLETELQRWREQGDEIGEGQTLANLAYLDFESGDLEKARGLYNESLRLLVRAGDKQSQAAALNELANLEWREGNLGTARTLYERSLSLAREVGDKQVEAVVVHGMAMLDMQTGNRASARRGFQESLRLKREVNDEKNIPATLMMLGQLEFPDGDHVVGFGMVRQAITEFDRLNMPGELEQARTILRQLEGEDSLLGKAGKLP